MVCMVYGVYGIWCVWYMVCMVYGVYGIADTNLTKLFNVFRIDWPVL